MRQKTKDKRKKKKVEDGEFSEWKISKTKRERKGDTNNPCGTEWKKELKDGELKGKDMKKSKRSYSMER